MEQETTKPSIMQEIKDGLAKWRDEASVVKDGFDDCTLILLPETEYQECLKALGEKTEWDDIFFDGIPATCWGGHEIKFV